MANMVFPWAFEIFRGMPIHGVAVEVPIGLPWDFHGDTMKQLWEHRGNTTRIQWEYHGTHMRIAWDFDDSSWGLGFCGTPMV